MAEQDKFLAMEVKTRKQLEEQEKLKKRKKRNYIVGFSCLGAAVLGLTAVYILSTQIWLVDLKYLPYVRYSYATHDDNGEATLLKVAGTEKNPLPDNFVIPNKVNGLTITKIANGAFAGIENLKSVKMSDNIKEIGDFAFKNCTNLEDIKLSKSIEFLGQDVFTNTPFMKKLDQARDINNISSILISISDSYWEKVEQEKGSADTIILSSKDSEIPEEYKNLNVLYLDEVNGAELRGWSDSLFQNNEHIKYVEIPSYLSSVPSASFYGCTNLEKVVFTDNTTKIGDEAFAFTPNLKTVELGDNITTIGNYAFQESGLDKLDVGNNVTKVGKGIFKDCLNISEFSWPEHLDKIPEETFSGCKNLSTLNISDVSYHKITSIGRNAFEETKLRSFAFPINMAIISDGIFKNATELESVTMYESETIYDKEGDSTVNGIIAIGYEAFQNTKLKEVILVNKDGSPVTPAGEVNLPTAVMNFSTESSSGENFGGDIVGAPIKKFTFSYNATSTSSGMFKNCKELEEIVFMTHHGDGVIKGLENIAMDTFYGCEKITTLDHLPNSINTLESRALANMPNLKSVTIPTNRSLKLLDESLFENDVNLEKVTIGENIYALQKYAFHNNFKLDYVYLPFVGKLDNGYSKLNMNHRSFFNMREGIRDEYDELIEGATPLTKEQKMPIFLEVTKEQCNPKFVLQPEYDSNKQVIEYKEGWYDPLTCQPYYKGEWHFEGEGANRHPVINTVIEGGEK